MLISRVGSRLGAGAAIEGPDGRVGADLPENGLERIVAGGLPGRTDGLEGWMERGALGVKDGLDGAIARGLLGVNEGPEGVIEGDLAELSGELEPRDGPGLELGLMASRLAETLPIAALRSEPPRAARTLGITCKRLDGRMPASEKPAW